MWSCKVDKKSNQLPERDAIKLAKKLNPCIHNHKAKRIVKVATNKMVIIQNFNFLYDSMPSSIEFTLQATNLSTSLDFFSCLTCSTTSATPG